MAGNRLLLYLFALPNTVHWGYLNGKGRQDISFLIKLMEKKFSAASYWEESHETGFSLHV